MAASSHEDSCACAGCDLLGKLKATLPSSPSSPSSREETLFILYGSETGNAKSIAEKLHGLALAKRLPAKLHTLDEYDKIGVVDNAQPRFCAIVCSTTGNGDAPIGAERFSRYVKKRTLAADTLQQCRYLVLALGDTNYDKFCYIGKMLDTRLKAIGAVQVEPVVLCDEVLGMEQFVEPWIATVFVRYAEEKEAAPTSSVVEPAKQEEEAPVVPVVAVEEAAPPAKYPATSSFAFVPTPIEEMTAAAGDQRVVVLYGSETGNAKAIAERLHLLLSASSSSSPSSVHALDEYDTVGLVGSTDLFCIVCSTTGNGDPPGGAERFFRYVKRRTHAPDLVQCSYCVLALGDTNYDKFCHVGKTIDARMKAIGGRQVLPVTLVDEVVGMESQVEPWLERVLLTVTTGQPQQQGAEATPVKEEVAGPVGGQQPAAAAAAAAASTSLPPPPASAGWQMPRGCSLEGADFLQQGAEVLEAKTKRLGRVRQPISVARLLANQSNVRFVPCRVVRQISLTPERDAYADTDRIVMKLTLASANDDSSSSLGPWTVGDAVGIKTSNPSELVRAVASRLGLLATAAADDDNKVLLTALEHHVDLSTTPDRGFLRTLASHCTDKADEARMNYLSSFEGKQDYERVLQQQKLNVYEVLELFPSCRPANAEVFFGSLMEPPQSRYYSIASSPLLRQDTLDVCYSVVRTVMDGGRVVRGVCTNNELHGKQPGDVVHMFVKPNSTFKLPVDETKPLVMCGPGTGVAPFIGFIQHRQQERAARAVQRRRNAPECGSWRGGLDFEDELEAAFEEEERSRSASPFNPTGGEGKSTLYFGCRNVEEDYLYRQELAQYVAGGALSSLRVAFSRPPPPPKDAAQGRQGQYVQHLMLEDAEELADQILNQGAYFFVCGDGTRMARDVQQAVCSILSSQGNLTEEEAKTYVAEMQRRGRYVQDIW